MLPSLRNSYFWLLGSLLLFFLLTPFIVNSQVDLYVFGILFSAVLLTSVYNITHSRWMWISGVILASTIFVILWLNNLLIADHRLLNLEYFLVMIYFGSITVIVFHDLFTQKVINVNIICGAICGYLLMGLIWGFIYGTISHLVPHSFTLPVYNQNLFDSHFQRFTYFSFVTLTTLGYGDITPVSNIARTLAWVEAAAGQIYLTVWIAQLVGLHIAARIRDKEI